MKKLLISLTILFSLFLGINSVNALDTLSGTYPEPPEITDSNYSNKNYLIYKNTSNVTRLLIIPNEAKNIYTSLYEVSTDRLINKNTSGNSFFPTTSTTTNDFTNNNSLIYDLKNNSWVSSGKGKSFMWSEIYYSTLPIQGTDFTGQDSKPKINISLIDKQEEFEKINVNFSAFNTDKYIYYYSIDRENWIDILENDYKYTSYINGTLYVMILDKQEFIESAESGNIVYNPLATATYTFSDISEIIPELKFKLNISDSCKIRKNTEEIIVCKNLDIEIINYNSIDKYMWQYSFERENFGNIYTNKFNIEFSENKTIYFKLLDKINNEELKYVTYTITGISSVPGDIGAYIKMNGSYNKDSFSYEIDTYFYNYDSSLYNYYYSEDGINWNEISSYNMLATTNSSIKHIILKFYKDLTVYVKIENKNNEYVNAATYTITYFSNNDSLKDSLDLFSSKSYLTGQAFKNFSEIWNKFKRETGIYTYLLMVVLSSIALLLIKSFRK